MNIFLIVVSREVQGIRRGDIVVNEGVVLDDTEFLSWVKHIASGVSVQLFIRALIKFLLFLFFLFPL